MQDKHQRILKVQQQATHLLFGALVVLQILDLHSTWIGLGPREETNALIVALGHWYGSIHTGLLIAKGFVLALIWMMYTAWKKAPSKSFARWVLLALLALINTAMAAVVFSNYGA